jgi:hypothetical protein
MSRLTLAGAALFAAGLIAGAAIAISLPEARRSAPVAEADVAQVQTPAPETLTGIALFQQASDLELAFSIAPAVAGPNNLNFYLRDVDGDERPYQRLVARITYLDGRQPPRQEEPVQLHEGHWPLDAYDLGLAGRWRIEASVSREGFPDVQFSFDVPLPHR